MPEEYVAKREEHLRSKESVKQRQHRRDQELWEQNRLMVSGTISSREQLAFEDLEEEAGRVHLLVSNIMLQDILCTDTIILVLDTIWDFNDSSLVNIYSVFCFILFILHTYSIIIQIANPIPPFLDGRAVFSRQLEPVVPIKDPTSDMAVLSKKGSPLVKFNRENKERKKGQKREWELAGSRLGELLGVKKEGEDEDKENEDAENDFKSNQQFSKHIIDKEVYITYVPYNYTIYIFLRAWKLSN